ncbi:MAG: hypothetical protein IPF92_29520 [Myxococcales bacterium]|jgi:hypothetical protein|nr:hypothetical protein [Myxococcales bacterium]MBL0196820.1 hypothetical protein [Myxococcales bacterium]HQY64455.1 hypothetical protein [Polyangiaceae bacterium]
MKRSIFALLLAVPVLTFSLVAGAAERTPAHPKMQFPVAASTFQSHHDARVAKMRTKLEARIVEKKLDAKKAASVRARFEARVVKVQAAIARATADGTVTQAEADEIRAARREGRHGGGRSQARRAGAPKR